MSCSGSRSHGRGATRLTTCANPFLKYGAGFNSDRRGRVVEFSVGPYRSKPKTNCSACRNVPCAGVRIARCCTRGLSIRYPIARLECAYAGNAPAAGRISRCPSVTEFDPYRIFKILYAHRRATAPIMASSVLRGEFRDVSATAIPTGDLGPVASPRPDWGRPSYRGSSRSNYCWIRSSVIRP